MLDTGLSNCTCHGISCTLQIISLSRVKLWNWLSLLPRNNLILIIPVLSPNCHYSLSISFNLCYKQTYCYVLHFHREHRAEGMIDDKIWKINSSNIPKIFYHKANNSVLYIQLQVAQSDIHKVNCRNGATC